MANIQLRQTSNSYLTIVLTCYNSSILPSYKQPIARQKITAGNNGGNFSEHLKNFEKYSYDNKTPFIYTDRNFVSPKPDFL